MRYLLSLVVLTSCGGSEAPSTPAPSAAAPSPSPPVPVASRPGASSRTSGYQGSDKVAGAGAITGSVSYAGDKTDRMLSPDADLDTCGQGPPERPANELVVTDGKLANAVVYLPDVPAGKHWNQDTVNVDVEGCIFEPHVSIGKLGGKIAARNGDALLHCTDLRLNKGKKQMGNITLALQDQVVVKTLKKSGFLSWDCDGHDWMQAWVYVARNPYATVSDADGSFTLSEVPAGDYTARVWHELLGEQEASVTVLPGGTATLEIAYN